MSGDSPRALQSSSREGSVADRPGAAKTDAAEAASGHGTSAVHGSQAPSSLFDHSMEPASAQSETATQGNKV